MAKGNTWALYVDSDHAGEKKLYSQSRTGVAFFLNGFPICNTLEVKEATKHFFEFSSSKSSCTVRGMQGCQIEILDLRRYGLCGTSAWPAVI